MLYRHRSGRARLGSDLLTLCYDPTLTMNQSPTRSIPPGLLRMLPPWLRLVLIVVVALAGWWYQSRGGHATSGATPNSSPTSTARPPAASRSGAPVPGEGAILDAFRDKRSDVQVQVTATVAKVLADDTDGDRHQKFLIKLSGGHTLLVAHNIDLAPRVPVKEKEQIELRGEYEWTEQGGTIHWTHKSARGPHPDGWIKCDGKTYE